MKQRPTHGPGGRFPCLFLRLEPGDAGFDDGYRYRVDQDDPEDQHFFYTRKRAQEFVDIHGFAVVGLDEMEALREDL